MGAAALAVTPAGAALTTGLIRGLSHASAASVNLGSSVEPHASYVATMRTINEENGDTEVAPRASPEAGREIVADLDDAQIGEKSK